MDAQEHWEKVYGTKAPHEVSWFRPHLESSLRLIEHAAGQRSASIIDVGGGASSLVDDLIRHGYRHVTVLDISRSAIDEAKKRLRELSKSVQWLRADVTQINLPAQSYDVWHDRAVFHFLTKPEDRIAYVRNVCAAVKPGGHVIVSTFGPEGPTKCSGLDVVRYDAQTLHDEFGRNFRLIESSKELHHTPSGMTQQFLYCYCKFEPKPSIVTGLLMPDNSDVSILNHPLEQPSVFTARSLMDDVRRTRQIPNGVVPPLCFLEFDGDLTDWLVREGIAKPFGPWPCFHTTMLTIELEGVTCGVIPRTIGGPYAVFDRRTTCPGGGASDYWLNVRRSPLA